MSYSSRFTCVKFILNTDSVLRLCILTHLYQSLSAGLLYTRIRFVLTSNDSQVPYRDNMYYVEVLKVRSCARSRGH